MPTNRERERKKARVVSARQRVDEHKSEFSKTSINVPEGMSMFNPKKSGTYRLEIIPFTAGEGNPFAAEGDLYFERTFYVHRFIGANQDNYICSRKTFGKPCPICDHRAKLSRKPDADEDLIKDLAPKERQLWLVLDHADEEKGVQLWDVSFHLFGKYLDNKIKGADDEDKEKYEQFADPVHGSTIKAAAEAKSYQGKDYLDFNDIELKDRKVELDGDLFDNAPCLDECIKEIGYEELKKIFLQTGGDDDEDDEDDDKPKKKPGKKPAEDDDEPTPKKKPVGKPKPKPKEEEEDDGDGDEPAEMTAEDAGLEVGMKVKHRKLGECEVVHISKDGTSLRLEDEDGEIHKAIAPDEVKIIEEEEEEPAPKKKPGKPPGKKPKPDEDDDEPTPRKKGKTPPKGDDDDWDDDEPLDDDDD